VVLGAVFLAVKLTTSYHIVLRFGRGEAIPSLNMDHCLTGIIIVHFLNFTLDTGTVGDICC
jgi:hypothetical protein